MLIATVADGGNTSVDFTVANVLGYISSKSLTAYAVDVIKRKRKKNRLNVETLTRHKTPTLLWVGVCNVE